MEEVARRSLVAGIGRRMKSVRQDQGKTLTDIAREAGISKSLLSKIENGRTVPSLPVMLSILSVLGVDLSYFFHEVEQENELGYVLQRGRDYRAVQKEEAVGFNYTLMVEHTDANLAIEVVMLELEPGAKREMVSTDGYEYLYMVHGEIEYHLGDEELHLDEGDSLLFNGRIPHVPLNLSNEVARLLVVYMLPEQDR